MDFSSVTNVENAFPGSASFINVSPIKKPLKPAFLKDTIVSTLLSQLYAMAGLSAGILSFSCKDVLISTSKVFRLRLLTPTISTSSQICFSSSSLCISRNTSSQIVLVNTDNCFTSFGDKQAAINSITSAPNAFASAICHSSIIKSLRSTGMSEITFV